MRDDFLIDDNAKQRIANRTARDAVLLRQPHQTKPELSDFFAKIPYTSPVAKIHILYYDEYIDFE